MNASAELVRTVKQLQAGEMMERLIYLKLQRSIKDEADRKVLLDIADDEQRHYEIWKSFTKVDVRPDMARVYWYVFLGRLLGYTFTIKLMENRQNNFGSATMEALIQELAAQVPNFSSIVDDEEQHEQSLIQMIDEEKLKYVGSMVLGLNDALVEFTGSLAGWTFAMQSNRLIVLAGLITGISASLSMASSEYLSSRNEGNKNALKSAIYTGSPIC